MIDFNLEMNKVWHCDNYEFMKTIPDKYFDLCLTDPPYGLGLDKSVGAGKLAKINVYTPEKDWDKGIPEEKYFIEMQRISKNQIFWGGNYFIDYLKATPCMLVWNKNKSAPNFADGELAWTSFKSPLRIFKYTWDGMIQEEMGGLKEQKVHPTQKPVALFEWCLQNYSKEGDKIFDPYAGSGTTALACMKLKRDYVLCERETEFYNTIINRIEKEKPKIQFNTTKKLEKLSIFDMMKGDK